MSPKLRSISSKELIKFFETYAFEVISQNSSHIKIRRVVAGMRQNLIIPNHNPIKTGTFREIFNQATKYIPEDDLRKFFWTG